jgi:hypothetical protein
MRKRSIVFLLVTMLAIVPMIALGDSATKLAWMPGWDDQTQPLDYAHSFVKFGQSGNGRLQITYHLQGALPNTTHSVGLHVFQCLTIFGQYLASPCGSFVRDGSTSFVSPVDLGTITTDQYGNGNLEVNVTGIIPGTYEIVFHTRLSTLPANTNACSGSPNPCSVIYESPGPFGVGAVEITVP